MPSYGITGKKASIKRRY